MARPIAGDSPKSQMLNCKLTQEENDELARVVKESNVPKSDIIRSALKIIFARAAEARKRVKEQAEEMIKSGNFSFDKIKSVNNMLAEEMEKELNHMAYDKAVDQRKKDKKKKEDSKE